MRVRAGLTARDVVLPVVSWVVTVGTVVTIPLMERVDPDPRQGAVPVVLGPAWWPVVVALTAQAVVLLWTRRRPYRVFVVEVALSVLVIGLTPAPGVSAWTLPLLIAAYMAMTSRGLRPMLPTLIASGFLLVAAGAAAAVLRSDRPGELVAAAFVQAVLVIGIPAAVAALVLSRRSLVEARRRQSEAVEGEREARRQAAISQERAAMARELHDIAAHHLSGIALSSAAVERLVRTDPDRAEEMAHQVREQSTVLLHNLRRLVGLLREDGPETTGPTPTAAGIVDLVEEHRARGEDVVLTTYPADGGGEPARDIGPLAQLAAYRMVQESLANAVKYAPGAACRVVVDDREERTMTVTVDNEAAATSPTVDLGSGGFGLVGMRERAELTGSALRYGPRAEGGWWVRLVIPRDEMEGAQR